MTDIKGLLDEYQRLEAEERDLLKKRNDFIWKVLAYLGDIASSGDRGNLRVCDLDFSQRVFNCLRRKGIVTLIQLATTDDKTLKGIRGFGKRCFNEVNDKLMEYGFPPIKETVISVTNEDRYGDDDE